MTRTQESTLSGFTFSNVKWGDFDMDGDLDVIGKVGSSTAAPRLFRNDGPFGFYEVNVAFQALGSTADFQWADVDSDNDLDLIFVGCTYSCYDQDFRTYFYENRGAEGFHYRESALPGARRVSVADFSGDGKPDLALVSYDYKLQLWIGTDPYSFAKILTVDGFNQIALTDFDNDGNLDFSYGKYLYRNRGDLTFQTLDLGFVNNGGSDYLWADFDQDGDMDFLRHSSSWTYDGWTFHKYDHILQFENLGNLNFADRGLFPWMASFSDPASGDFDGDGDVDFVLSGQPIYTDSAKARIYWNRGNWNFKGVPLDTVAWKSYEFSVVDKDGDNDLDLFGFGFYAIPTSFFVNQVSPPLPKPLAPSTQQDIRADSVILSWDFVPRLSYNLSIRRDDGFIIAPQADLQSGKPFLTQNANQFQHKRYAVDRQRLPAGYYRWSVQAVNQSGGTSAFSDEKEFTVYDVNLPHAPGALTVSSVSSTEVVLDWLDNSSDELMFEVERSSTSGNAGFTTVATGPSGTTHFADLMIESNSIYYYRIKYSGPSGTAYSNVVRARTQASLVPSPENLVGIASTSSSVELSWDYAGTNHEGFLVQRAPGMNQSFATLDSVDASQRHFSDKSVSQLSNLLYRVVAFNGNDWSDFSNTAMVTVPMHSFDTLTINSLKFNTSSEGMTWADIDNDGDDDLFLATESKLLRNDGGGIFIPLSNTGIATVASNAYGTTSVWGDYDNDGWVDLFLGGTSEKIIYRNLNGSSFEQVKTILSFDKSDLFSATWVDMDNDGDLELSLGGSYERYYYRYDGGKTRFTRIELPPAPPNFRSTQSSAWGDFDNNGYTDAFLGNYGEDEILLNRDGENFDRVTNSPATENTNYSCCPIETPLAVWNDIDNDKDLDLTVAHSSFRDIQYQNNNGKLDSVFSFGTDSNDYFTSMFWGDYDNDGDLDLLHLPYYYTNYLANDGVGHLSVIRGHPINRGVTSRPTQSFTDIDGDGFLDLVSVSATVKSYRNVANQNSWLVIRLAGRVSNSSGLGSTVFVKAGGKWQRRDVVTGHSYHTQQGFRLHFGLGPSEVVDSIMVRWSSGARQYLDHVPVNQAVTIDEAGAQEKPFYSPSNLWGVITSTSSIQLNWQDNSSDEDGFKMFQSLDGISYTEIKSVSANVTTLEVAGLSLGETYYYKIQGTKDGALSGFTNSFKVSLFVFSPRTVPYITTLHERTSGASWCDVDNDGLPDLLLCGQAYSGDVLYRNLGGKFSTAGISLNTQGLNSLSRSGSWGDMNNDGYSDLFIAVGGNYLSSVSNKLLLNLGAGAFQQVLTGPLAQQGSGNHIGAWGDFNNDGNIDLSVSNDTYLIRFQNMGGTAFTPGNILNDQVKQLVASDIDLDGDLDLLGRPESFDAGIKIFTNSNGAFGYSTGKSLNQFTSRGFVIEDFDGDGDFDLLTAGIGVRLFLYDRVAGTFVLKPNVFPGAGSDFLGCFAGDYDNNGHLDVILTRTQGRHDLYLNDGALQFSRYNDAFADWPGLNAAGAADYNGDGALDLIMMATFGENRYLLDGNPGSNHWLRVKLRGTVSNRDGIGAKVKVFTGKAMQLREIRSGSGQYAFDEQVAHFGLGTHSSVDYVKVEWPSGIQQWIANASADTLLEINEAESLPPSIPAPTDLTAILTEEGLVELNWNDQSTDELGYVIERAKQGEPFSEFRTTDTDAIQYYDSTFSTQYIDQQVRYRVRTLWYDHVVSAPSNEATVHVVVTQLENLAAALKVYPIPATELLQIESTMEIIDIQMHSILGVEVLSQPSIHTKQSTISVRSLSEGTYILTIRTPEGNRHMKVVVLR